MADSTTLAVGLSKELEGKLDRLAESTTRSRSYRYIAADSPGAAAVTRELVILPTPYIVPYRVRADLIEIRGVFHGARRWPERPPC